ncbi:MAG: HEAT repeat domain-containing protein [Planctomycetes bacterium]|nr:HEAT repeat domain-containing protein [Planctomycetota bacterium]
MLLITASKLLLALASFQTAAPQTSEPLMWLGKMLAGDRKEPAKDSSSRYAGDLRRQLEDLRTRTELKRDFSEQLVELDTLRALADWWFDYPGKAELAAEISTTRAEWLEKLGRHDQAVFAAWHPFVMHEEYNSAPYNAFVMVLSDGKLADVVNQIDALPSMVELHKRFPLSAPAQAEGDAIEQAVRAAISWGDPASLRDFGTRCVPALQKLLLEGPEEKPERLTGFADPLAILLGIDRAAGESLILSTIGKRGPVWTLRAIRALNLAGVTHSSWVASADPYTPPRFDDPLTLQVIDALAAQPLTAQPYFELLKPLVGVGVITPAIQRYLLAQVQTSDPLILTALGGMLDAVRTPPEKRALYEAFLECPDPEMRRNCARALQHYDVGPATLRAAQHPDANVRVFAAKALVRHRAAAFHYPTDQANDPRDLRWYEVERTPEIEAALVKLAHDPEASVRTALVAALAGSIETPPGAVLEALLADPNPAVRAAAVYGWTFDPALQARVFEALADDVDVKVLDQVAQAMARRCPSSNQGTDSEFQFYLPALGKLLANSNVEFKELDPWRMLLRGAFMSPEGARVALEACLHGSRARELGPRLYGEIQWRSNNSREVPVFRVLEPAAVAELFAYVCTDPDAGKSLWAQGQIQQAITSGDIDAKAFLALARDARQPTLTRVRALVVSCSKAEASDAQAFLELLRGITPAEIDPDDNDPIALWGFLTVSFNARNWPPAALAGFAPKVLVERDLLDVLALRLAAGALRITHEVLDAATTAACVERWNRLSESQKREDGAILSWMDPRLDARVLQIWRSENGNPALARSLLAGMDAFPVEESVELVRGYITTDTVPGSMDDVRSTAVSILTRRLDDTGADALLKAIAATGNEAIRKQCFDGLAQIRQYQDEKASWEKRKGGEAARDQAIGDLLPMLSDKDATTRAAAARSLATLKAVEHLPKLIALLKDKDATVREAAQRALDALNAPEPKKP